MFERAASSPSMVNLLVGAACSIFRESCDEQLRIEESQVYYPMSLQVAVSFGRYVSGLAMFEMVFNEDNSNLRNYK